MGHHVQSNQRQLSEIQGYCVDDGHPEPPPESHLVMPESGRVTEYKYKSYACESGYRDDYPT